MVKNAVVNSKSRVKTIYQPGIKPTRCHSATFRQSYEMQKPGQFESEYPCSFAKSGSLVMGQVAEGGIDSSVLEYGHVKYQYSPEVNITYHDREHSKINSHRLYWISYSSTLWTNNACAKRNRIQSAKPPLATTNATRPTEVPTQNLTTDIGTKSSTTRVQAREIWTHRDRDYPIITRRSYRLGFQVQGNGDGRGIYLCWDRIW